MARTVICALASMPVENGVETILGQLGLTANRQSGGEHVVRADRASKSYSIPDHLDEGDFSHWLRNPGPLERFRFLPLEWPGDFH